MAPERRASATATVLFTDLVASTELMARLGDVAFDDLRRAHFAGLREVFTAHAGEEIKNTGDGLLVTFGSAADALAAAVAAQQATVRPDPAVPVPIEVRVALALGEVAFDAGDVFGTPVVEAARLVARAEPGQILTTAVVRIVAGSRAGVTFTDLGSVELKGLPEPVPVCSVAWARPEAARLPLPPLLSGVGRIFVGRDDLLAELVRLRKETVEGGCRAALLGGEPGIGKTRLATALAEAAHADGAVVLAGRCDEDLGVPFQPFVEALQHYATHAAAPRLGRFGGELSRLVPEISEMIPGLAAPLRSDPETERYRLFDAVAAWLADVSAEAPVLLVIDDLHWAAKPTFLLLRHVLRSAEPVRLLVVVTYRDSELGRGHPLTEFLADLRRFDGVGRFSLTGLDRAGVSDFIEAAAGHRLSAADEGLPAAVWAETEGNPFFVAEVLRHLTETGGVEQRDGRWVVTAPVDALGIPEGVREVVGRRLARLSEEANRALTIGAVAGLEFEPAVVRVAADLADDDLIAALEEAVTARLLSEVQGAGPRYRFAHALVRATLYDELSGPRRVAVHRRVADAIEAVHRRALDDHLPALAHHCARAVVQGDEASAGRAVDFAARAGDRALTQLAHDEAVAYYRQALQLLDDGGGAAAGDDGDGRRLELLIALGDAQRRAGDPDHRTTLLDAADRARRRGDADALARAALTSCRPGYTSAAGAIDLQRVAALEDALEAVTDQAGPAATTDPAVMAVRARLLASIGIELVYGELHRARRVSTSDEALALARTLEDPATLFYVLVSRFFAINSPATLGQRLADTAELLGLVETVDDPQTRFQAHWQGARVSMEAGDLNAAQSHADAAGAVAEELGQPVFRWMAGWAAFGLLQLAGQLAEANQITRDTFAIGEAGGQVDAGVIHAVQRYMIAYEWGRLDELEAEFTAVAEQLGPVVESMCEFVALIHCESGRLDRAREAFAPILARGYHLPEDTIWLGMTQMAAEIAHRLDDREGAAVLLDRLAPYPGMFSSFAGVTIGCTAQFLGLLETTLGHFDAAIAYLAEAAENYERVGAPAFLGRTRVAWAKALLARRSPGDADQAQALLTAAMTAARELGFVSVERRAAPLLAEI